MARRRRHREPVAIELNLTSMMDVVFLLIIFFILVTNYATADLPPLEPPEPTPSRAIDDERPNARLINVVPQRAAPAEDATESETIALRIADHVLFLNQKYPLNEVGLTALTTRLAEIKQAMPELEVDLRADRALAFDQVEPVMKAVTAAGIARVNLVARKNLKDAQD